MNCTNQEPSQKELTSFISSQIPENWTPAVNQSESSSVHQRCAFGENQSGKTCPTRLYEKSLVTQRMIQYRVSRPDLGEFRSYQRAHTQRRVSYLANVFRSVRVLDENIPEERLSRVALPIIHLLAYKFFPA